MLFYDVFLKVPFFLILSCWCLATLYTTTTITAAAATILLRPALSNDSQACTGRTREREKRERERVCERESNDTQYKHTPTKHTLSTLPQ